MSHSLAPDQNRGIIYIPRKPALRALIACALACNCAWAQKNANPRQNPGAEAKQAPRPVTLTRQEGLSVIAVARDPHLRKGRETDCSHLVHTIYERAGFSYPYADSADLYRGLESFRQVKHSQPGDLIVWRGHVGIVVNPARHIFFSSLSHGPGTDRYDAQYWKLRGPVRFYRYIKAETYRSVFRPE